MVSESTFQIKPRVGEGIYTKIDVANILHLPYTKVSQWMNEFWDDYTFGIKGNKAINFYTLIEFYTFYHLREMKISSQKIKKAHSIIAEDLNTKYPFARKIYATEKHGIWYEELEMLVKADRKQQLYLKDLLIPFLNKIEFNEENLAFRYFPTDAKKVVVDPKFQFGQPTIEGTGIKADIINGFYQGGESKETICKLYDLTIEQVNDAILYFKKSA
jgi:uncharacterized protein (DUF433 family)